MLDIKRIISEPQEVLANLRKRDPTVSLGETVALEQRRIELQTRYDSLRRELNEGSAEMARAGKGTTYFEETRTKLRELGDRAKGTKEELDQITTRLNDELLELPNMVLPAVPVSQNKEDKEIVRQFGSRPVFDFEPVDHVVLAERLGLIDFARGTKVAETGFPVYTGKGALLEWALINYMIDNARESGFNFMLLPFMNNTRSLVATGNLPKFADEIYSLKRDDLHMIPTAETPLTNLYRDETLDASQLPIRMASFSPCFRREAGSAGKLTRGLMRLHQFNKLETYTLCLPESATEEHQRLIENGERILKGLGLHYRLANLPSCDLAQQSAQTFDIEIWLPCLGQYSEVSSASNCTDYQARRANIRYKQEGRKGFVTTLNCSALATPRLMIAILESNQTADGHVITPEALRRYTRFDRI